MRSEILLIIIGMAVVTYSTRVGSLVLFRFTGIPSWLEVWLKHVPTAILTALIIPALILPKGAIDLSLSNHYLLAGLTTGLTAFLSRNVLASIGLGLLVMLSLKWFGL